MTIEDKVRQDLRQAILDKDQDKKDTLRMVIGEIPRLNKKAGVGPTDQEMEKIIRKLIKSETQVLELAGKDVGESLYINTLNEYIPQLMTQSEIEEWIAETIVLEDYNPKMKAIGVIMKELKGKADGNLVKKMLI